MHIVNFSNSRGRNYRSGERNKLRNVVFSNDNHGKTVLIHLNIFEYRFRIVF